MENLSVIMALFDHLNEYNSKTYIEHFDSESGIITLSDNLELNITDLTSKGDLEVYINNGSALQFD